MFDLSILSVLVIDDQKTMRMILRDLLRKIGIRQVMEASDGSEALSKLQSSTYGMPDVVICDLQMDGMDGLEFCNKLRLSKSEHLRKIPVLILTGDQDPFLHDVSKQLGVTSVLTKPVSSSKLADHISEAVGFKASDRGSTAVENISTAL